MKYTAKHLALAAAYTLTVLGCMAVLCQYSLYKCEFEGSFVAREWVVPATIIVGGLLLVGMGVAYINLYAQKNHNLFRPAALRFALGAVSGVLPLLLAIVMTGRFPESFYPSMQYVPFLLGGIVVAVSATWLLD